jgi:hypothetical protein
LTRERELLTAGELDVLLDRLHWYLGEAEQAASRLVAATGQAVEDNRAALTELEQTLTSQRRSVAELRRVLARWLLDGRAPSGRRAVGR